MEEQKLHKPLNVAIIVGAGKGKRVGNKDKPFLSLNGKPVLARSILPFEKSDLINEIILVVRRDKIDDAQRLVHKYNFKKIKKIVSGGRTRQDSVYNGLYKIKNADMVLVHDAVSPLLEEETIKDVIYNAKRFGAAIPAVPIKETIKKGNKYIKRTIDRKSLNLAQTPQAFKYEIIKKAYKSAKKNKFHGTDDASLVERLGYKVRIIDGSYKNIKITVHEDISIAERLLEKGNRKWT